MDEVLISRAIVETYTKDFLDYLVVDVAIVGGGPSGLVCAYYLAKEGIKTAVFEKHLRIGGGMPGGGMMFNRIVIQEDAKSIMKDFGITINKYKEELYTADSLETISLFCAGAIKKGARIFNLVTVEDVVIRQKKITGLVINWSAVGWSKLHVDPLALKADVVIDATGHDAEICRLVERKIGPNLNTKSGKVEGEKSMWAEVGEAALLDNTKEVYPGLMVCGMAANAAYGSPRMGAIFGGMLLSGKKAAEEAIKQLKKK